MTNAVIVSTARTPLAKSWKGAFNMTHGATLGGHAIKHAIARAGIDAAEIGNVVTVFIPHTQSIDAFFINDDGARLSIGESDRRRRFGISSEYGRLTFYQGTIHANAVIRSCAQANSFVARFNG